ncbi:pyrroline-5-carboxylate reductase [Companilactobacillus zhongbaensis]|uniref:pyrroline-5-carboxylate reductase n=1 Tax=Companilactobacillus zhongbaensis TaxID=2486009 RepID=UPI000F7705DC|nr:pyrroline-5-carboxylate reductase [Companilactobacillus zhongbaensis]
MKLGFIGAGKMASAIVTGILSNQVVSADDVFISDLHQEKLEQLHADLGLNVAKSNEDLIKQSDLIVVAVGPSAAVQVLSDNKDLINLKKTVVSIAAGLEVSKIEAKLNANTPVIRLMPNINVIVKEAGIALTANEYVSGEALNEVKTLFNSVGTVYELPESQFDIFTAISGSSPAYAYLFVDSIARAAVKNGMNKDLANDIASQAVLGSAKMIRDTKEEPWTLINNVSSPGGTTVAGLVNLEDNGFISTVIKGIDATIKKSNDLKK